MKKKIVLGIIIIVILFAVLYYCLSKGWGYYYFDIIAKSTPAVAAFSAYYMWKRNREKEIKNIEYKNDYYKKIIDERMDAYKKIKELVFLINQSKGFKDLNSQENKVHYIFVDTQHLEKVNSIIEDCFSYNIWLSKDANEKLVNINNFIVRIEDYVSGRNKNDFITWLIDNALYQDMENMKKIINLILFLLKQNRKIDSFITKENKNYIIAGTVCFNVLQEMLMDMRNHIYIDMKSLYKVAEFLEEGYNNTKV